MTNRIVIITGGMGDIATAIAQELSPDYKVIVALDLYSYQQAKGWLEGNARQGFKNIFYEPMDVTSFEQCQTVIEKIIKEFGQIDVLINNAGITKDVVFYKMTKKDWDDVIKVNLDGMFNVTRAVVGHMREREYGRIVNVSSVNGQKGQYSQVNYAASKAGVFGFTKSLAQELIAKNITVNSLSPGYVDTHLMKDIRQDILEDILQHIPAQRLGKPEEIAWAVKFLIHERSIYITGSNLSVNGGLHMY